MPALSLHIRKVRNAPDEARLLALIGGAAFLDGFFHFTPAPDMLEHVEKQHGVDQYAKYLANDENGAWVVTHQETGVPLGYMLCVRPEIEDANIEEDWEVKRIYLMHRLMGSGYARQLMDIAVAEAKGRGKKRLWLGVNDENRRAIRFYEKMGFLITGKRKFIIGLHENSDFIMMLAL